MSADRGGHRRGLPVGVRLLDQIACCQEAQEYYCDPYDFCQLVLKQSYEAGFEFQDDLPLRWICRRDHE